MATSLYFNNQYNQNEQRLIEDLVNEVIKIHGIDVMYLPRRSSGLEDNVSLDDALEYFDTAYLIDMAVGNIMGYGGRGDIMSVTGLQIQDNITFSVARRNFANEIGILENMLRPREKDLIYIPINRQFFQINFVEHESQFYEQGGLYLYELQCQKFDFSSERFTTGITEIDNYFESVTLDQTSSQLTTIGNQPLQYIDGSYVILASFDISEQDVQDQSEVFTTETDDFEDFDRKNPFGDP